MFLSGGTGKDNSYKWNFPRNFTVFSITFLIQFVSSYLFICIFSFFERNFSDNSSTDLINIADVLTTARSYLRGFAILVQSDGMKFIGKFYSWYILIHV